MFLHNNKICYPIEVSIENFILGVKHSSEISTNLLSASDFWLSKNSKDAINSVRSQDTNFLLRNPQAQILSTGSKPTSATCGGMRLLKYFHSIYCVRVLLSTLARISSNFQIPRLIQKYKLDFFLEGRNWRCVISRGALEMKSPLSFACSEMMIFPKCSYQLLYGNL